METTQKIGDCRYRRVGHGVRQPIATTSYVLVESGLQAMGVSIVFVCKRLPCSFCLNTGPIFVLGALSLFTAQPVF